MMFRHLRCNVLNLPIILTCVTLMEKASKAHRWWQYLHPLTEPSRVCRRNCNCSCSHLLEKEFCRNCCSTILFLAQRYTQVNRFSGNLFFLFPDDEQQSFLDYIHGDAKIDNEEHVHRYVLYLCLLVLEFNNTVRPKVTMARPSPHFMLNLSSRPTSL